MADELTELEAMRARKDAAYEERNRVVALLCSVFPSVRTRTAIEGWSDDWHGCVYLQLPTGQASWHFHDSHAHLFAHVPEGSETWDGHDTPEKYRRVAAAATDETARSRRENRELKDQISDLKAAMDEVAEDRDTWKKRALRRFRVKES